MTAKQNTSISELQTAIMHANVRILEILKQFRETTGTDITRIELMKIEPRIPVGVAETIGVECYVELCCRQ